MKISGFVYLGTADALVPVKILSEDLLGPLKFKALKALKKAQIGYKFGDHFVRKRKKIET